MADYTAFHINSEGKPVEGRAPVQPHQKDETPATPGFTNKEGGAASRYMTEIHNGVMTQRKDQVQGDMPSAPTSNDPMRNLRDAHGVPVASIDATPDTRIDLGGDVMPIKAAQAAGLVESTAQGWVLTEVGKSFFPFADSRKDSAAPAGDRTSTEAVTVETEANVNTKEQAETEAPDPLMDRPEATVDFLNAAVQTVGEESAQALAKLYLDGANAAAETVLAAMEMPETSKAKVAEIRAEFAQRLDAVAISEGIEADELPRAIEWCESDPTRKAALREAREQAVNGRTAKLRALAQEFTEQRILRGSHAEGVVAFPGPDGRLLVKLPGHPAAMPFKEALSKKLITVSEGE